MYYNTAAVIDADGKYLGKYRKIHIPQVQPGFWEKFYFRPGNLGYPVFKTQYGNGRRLHLLRPPLPRRRARARPQRRGDRVQPVGDRRRALRSTSGSSNSRPTPSRTATSSARSIGVGSEAPWNIGEFYGPSYFCRPARQDRCARGAATPTSVLIADLDLDLIREVRNTWQFYRDRRPETYGAITARSVFRSDTAGCLSYIRELSMSRRLVRLLPSSFRAHGCRLPCGRKGAECEGGQTRRISRLCQKR